MSISNYLIILVLLNNNLVLKQNDLFMYASKFLKRKCLEILELLDEHIPYYYVKLVQNELKKNDLIRTNNQIISVRNGHTYDLDVIKALITISNVNIEMEFEEEMTNVKTKMSLL